ncbi:arginine and glutamate-rich protein 1-like, partial [Benincasa hispida]|uniref:arginine and glutamate-rich protein 1-like n=1 Tax=Benincasa hispida TaxID=102211 RepID=UPI00190178C2
MKQNSSIKKKERSEEGKQRKERLRKRGKRRKRRLRPRLDGESTLLRVDKVESVQLRESTQPEEETTQVRLVATDDGEGADITPLMWRRNENAPQGSAVDPPILHDALEEKERRREEEEENQEKMLRAQLIITEGSRRRKLQDEKVHRNNAKSTEEERKKLEEEQRIFLASE